MTEVERLAYKIYIDDKKHISCYFYLIPEAFIGSVNYEDYIKIAKLIIRQKKLERILHTNV